MSCRPRPVQLHCCVTLTHLQGNFYWQTRDKVVYQNWRNSHWNEKLVKQYRLGLETRVAICPRWFCPKYQYEDLYTYKHFLGPYILQKIHPGNLSCGALFLPSLAEPEWLTVPCEADSLAMELVCQVDQNQNKSRDILANVTREKIVHERSCVLNDSTCYVFVWILIDNPHLFQINRKQQVLNNVETFQYLFDAVSSKFPPIFAVDFKTSFTFKRYFTTYKYMVDTTRDHATGIVVFAEKGSKAIIGLNLFQCADQSFISMQYICDGQADCLSKTDERGCHCNKAEEYSGKCKHLLTENSTQPCSIFYLPIPQHNGSCTQYGLGNKRKKESIMLQNYTCTNGQVISRKYFNDLVSDCGEKSDDEPFMVAFLGENRSHSCSQEGKLSCREGHCRCYEISDICKYQLDILNHLVPCRTGEHLEKCSEVQCNMMYHCPGFYCIPWSNVCDGKRDCPQGRDESEEHGCTHARSCSGMFQCRKIQICIHLGDICDGEWDCVHGDDEDTCSLKAIVCPLRCECLTFVIRCFKMRMSVQIQSSLPFWIFHVKYCPKRFIRDIITKMHTVLLVVFNHDNIDNHLWETIQKIQYPYLIDVGFNEITTIGDNGFPNLSPAKSILLNNNHILNIGNYAFLKLNKLRFLNVANNLLLSVALDMFRDLSALSIINISNNSFIYLSDYVFRDVRLDIVFTDNQTICCLLGVETICAGQGDTGYNSCHEILINIPIKIVAYSISAIIVIANLVTSALQRWSYTRGKDKTAAYGTTVVAINFFHIMHGTFIVILWGADLFYRNKLMLQDFQWKSSPLCFSAYAIVFSFNLLSPFSLSFLSLSQLMVVVYPFDSSFKETKFVQKCISIATVAVMLLTTGMISLLWTMYGLVPSDICSAFLDQTNKVVFIVGLCWFVVLLQLFAAISICVMYSLLIRQLMKSIQATEKSKSKKQSLSSSVVQLVALATSNFLCLVPSGVIYLCALFLHNYPEELIVWTVVIVSPINSIVNPIVFASTSIRKITSS